MIACNIYFCGLPSKRVACEFCCLCEVLFMSQSMREILLRYIEQNVRLKLLPRNAA